MTFRNLIFQFSESCTSHLAPRTCRLLTLVITASLLLATTACKKDEFKPSKLVGPLYSGQSLETVERKLDLKPGDWEVLEDRKPLSSDKRPMFRIFTFSKKQFPLLDIPGEELVMTFYNDRLMTVQFYPYNLDAFKAALQSQDSVSLSPDGDSSVAPSTRIWVGKDPSKKLYVGFMDKALMAEHDEWMRKYNE